jgi:formylglycine-generating enzyme required for sulfatase activity
MSKGTLARLMAAASLIASCQYRGEPPDGVVTCQGNAGCPGGYRCLSKPGGDLETRFCCKTASCGVDVGVDAAPPEPDTAPSIPRDALQSRGDDTLAADGRAIGEAGLADAPPADAGPDAGTPDVPVPPDLSLPVDVGPDVEPDAGNPCPTTTRGPGLVRAGTFCVDATEVTNVQYTAFVQAKAGDVSGQIAACKWNASYVPGGDGVVWPYSAGTENHPVVNVDWCDAYAFCQWSGKRLCGKVGGGRLTSVSAASALNGQWVNACTGNGRVTYPYGLGFDRSKCNVSAPTESGSGVADVMSYPMCVGGFPGLYDMSGNVEEWVDACDKDTGAGDSCGVAGNSAFIGTMAPSELACDSTVFGSVRNTRFVLLGFRCCAD